MWDHLYVVTSKLTQWNTKLSTIRMDQFEVVWYCGFLIMQALEIETLSFGFHHLEW
jgi:hypothetical protein